LGGGMVVVRDFSLGLGFKILCMNEIHRYRL